MNFFRHSYWITFILLLVLAYYPGQGAAQSVRINEYLSSNNAALTDDDGDHSDWIEIYNSADATFDLTGFSLTDHRDDLQQWTFPAATLDPQGYLIIFASGKDRRNQVAWNTLVDWGDNFQYHLGSTEPAANWNTVGFNDAGWQTGPSGFGYGDGDDATVLSSTISVYLRKTFTIDDTAAVSAGILHMDFDDGFIAYLNGTEIARSNMGNPGIPFAHDEPATSSHEAEMYHGGSPMPFPIEVIRDLIQPGQNVLAIQGHNVSAGSSDMTVIPFLTLGFSGTTGENFDTAEELDLTTSKLHTNFKINSGGEPLYLVNPEAAIVDSVPPDSLPTDVSKGRYPDGTDQWLFYSDPTPGAPNTGSGYAGITTAPDFSHPGGYHTGAFDLTLSTGSPNAIIYYSTDGTDPEETSQEYTGPIQISETTVIRAKAFENGKLASKTVTNTYLMDGTHTLPVIALTTTPQHLWDNETGIYVLGDDYETQVPYFGANFWEDWERPIHIEMYETDGTRAFSHDAGTKIFGGWSRARAQKSMAIFFRGEYGTAELDYQLFDDLDIDTFSSIVLRNSANDWDNTLMRDGFMQGLVRGVNLETQAYQPCVVYLNGEYWGILNIREKLNEDYLAQHFDVDPDAVDILESNAGVVEGGADHYQGMIDFIKTHNMSIPANYAEVKARMDIENFITYQAVQIYFDNQDWPGNNIKFWRPQTPDGKWRWLLYDTDYGFGIFDDNAYQNNTLEFATATDGPNWPNPPWSTFLLRSLLNNAEFRQDFINRFADLLNTVFATDTVRAQIEEKQAMIEPEIQEHIDLWSQDVWWNPDHLWWNQISHWYDRIQVLHTFAVHRPTYVLSHIVQKFGLAGTIYVQAEVSPPGAGEVQINSVIPQEYPWSGIYFKGVSLPIRAIPKPGYRFTGWDSHPEWNGASVEINPSASLVVKPVFVPDSSTGSVVINEINYHPVDDFDTEDWLELFNNRSEVMDISGWVLSDEDDDHRFTIPDNTMLESGGYLVICNDMDMFRTYFPDINPMLGNTGFGFSNGGELLRLFDAAGNIVDSLTYDDEDSWPDAPDGDGPTLELINPNLDNADPANWAVSADHGTPGNQNSAYELVNTHLEENIPSEFALLQNYPNPFNATTVIRYKVPQNAFVRLTVYNLRGEIIKTLIAEKQTPGTYTAQWSGTDRLGQKQASGVYFLRMDTGAYSSTRKMILIQ